MTVKVSPAAKVAVPVNNGVVSAVVSELTVGAAGAMVSTVTGTVAGALMLPAASVAVTTVWQWFGNVSSRAEPF